MLEKIFQDAQVRMQKAIEALKNELAKLRTGRAHPSLLEHVKVEYYGNEVPLNQAANVSVGDARTLVITPWDKAMVQAIEKAILNSGLGLNPSSAGTVIRVPIPALTEERRRDLVKVVKQEGEQARVAIRNARRDANAEIKELLKAKELGEDDERRAQDKVQKLTDDLVHQVDSVIAEKEQELLQV